MVRWGILLVVVGCSGDKTGSDTGPTNDADGDGFTALVDCDDADPAVHPDATDAWYDGVDSNCDGADDNDADGDGHAASDHGGDDCDDAEPTVNPQAPEVCDGLDNDCNGTVDDDPTDGIAYYVDGDGDGYGSGGGQVACGPGADRVDQAGDCDDVDPAVHPGAPTVDCDGKDDDCDPSTPEAGVVTLQSTGLAYPTLDAAIAAASDGDTIDLCEGGYSVNAVIDRPLTVVGTYGAAVTRLDGGGLGPVITVLAGPSGLTGVTVTNGLGGVSAGSSVPVTLTDSIVTGNNQAGGLVAAPFGQFWLVRTDVVQNQSDGAGGGVMLGAGGAVDLQDSTVDRNTAATGGGGVAGEATTTITGDYTSEIADNSAAYGGGIDMVSGDIARVVVTGNLAPSGQGGGIRMGDGQLNDVTVTNNTGDLGGGLAVTHNVLAARCTFDGNGAITAGGGVWAGGNEPNLTTVTLVDSAVTANNAADGGGLSLTDANGVSQDTDWGVGLTDNAPNDVAMPPAVSMNLPGVYSFNCTNTASAGAVCSS